MSLPSSIPAIIDAQRKHFASGATREISARLQALERLQGALVDRQDALLAALHEDLAKPEAEAFLAEYYFLLQELRLIRKRLRRWLKPRRVRAPLYFWPCRNKISREPRGVALILAPWNYPVQLSLAPLIAAIAAGNTVLLKPSEHTPACERFLVELIADCFPPEHATVLTGGPEVAAALLGQPTDFIFFTGSNAVGEIVAREAAKHLTPHILELGGKCPCVVDASADLAIAARRILIAKLFNAGQTCFAPDFVLAHESIRADLTKELATLLEARPWEQEMARIINARHFERLEGLLEEPAITKGADDRSKNHLAPRLLPEATWDSPAMQEEIFGPILPILAFQDLPGLLASLRDKPAPLALYCFSKDRNFSDQLLAAVPSGSVCLNDIGKQASNLHLPFGGTGASGHGRYRGKAGIEAFTYERPITTRFSLPDPFELLPPREKMTRSLRKWMR